jgi:hypothetical protein
MLKLITDSAGNVLGIINIDPLAQVLRIGIRQAEPKSPLSFYTYHLNTLTAPIRDHQPHFDTANPKTPPPKEKPDETIH